MTSYLMPEEWEGLSINDKIAGRISTSPYAQPVPLPTWFYSQHIFGNEEDVNDEIRLTPRSMYASFWKRAGSVVLSFEEDIESIQGRNYFSFKKRNSPITFYHVEDGEHYQWLDYPPLGHIGTVPLCELTYGAIYQLHVDPHSAIARDQIRLISVLSPSGVARSKKWKKIKESSSEYQEQLSLALDDSVKQMIEQDVFRCAMSRPTLV